MDVQGALGRGWSDTPQGWSEYVTHLLTIAGNHEEQKRLVRELDLGAEGTVRSLLSKLRRAEKQQYSA
ncbi:MAG TPA: hypothetical protein VGA56_00495 [Opitutaceae bacterium]